MKCVIIQQGETIKQRINEISSLNQDSPNSSITPDYSINNTNLMNQNENNDTNVLNLFKSELKELKTNVS